MKIQRGDMVVVIAGNGKSKTPRKVASVRAADNKVVVQGVNSVLRHVRKGHPKSPQGGRLSIDLPIHVSNVMLYCESCSSPTRVGLRYADDGGKERYCKKCEARISQISPPNPKRAKA